MQGTPKNAYTYTFDIDNEIIEWLDKEMFED